MSKTRHIQARMSQRAINQKLLNLTLKFGIEYDDGKVILNRQGLDELMRQLRELQQAAQQAANKGGLVVICKGETLITTYRLESYRRKPAKVNSSKEAE